MYAERILARSLVQKSIRSFRDLYPVYTATIYTSVLLWTDSVDVDQKSRI